MPACKCGRWFADGAALRTHCQERHPEGRGSQIDWFEGVADE